MTSTDTATIVPSSWKTWVMPTLRPIKPTFIEHAPERREQASPAQGAREHGSERTSRCVSERAERATRRWAAWSCRSSHLDLDVDARCKRESHQCVDGLGRGV